jgi:transcriptional regulator with XRE-family HTH domain
MSVGQIFVMAREKKNIELIDVSNYLNISTTHLNAIENDIVSELPPKVYAIGFVRAYSNLLDLDAEKLVYLFKLQTYGAKSHSEIKEKVVIKPVQKDSSIIFGIIDIIKKFFVVSIASMTSLVVLSAVIIFIIFGTSSSSETKHIMNIPKLPVELEEQPPEIDEEFITGLELTTLDMVESTIDISEPMDVIVKPDEGSNAYGVEPLLGALAFKASSDVPFEVRNIKDNRVLFSEILKKGDVFYGAEDQDIMVSAQDGSLVNVYLDNQPVGVLSLEPELVKLRPFSAKALRLQNKP